MRWLSSLLLLLVIVGCGQTKSVSLSEVRAVRESDERVTVTVTLVSHGHIPLEPSDEFCVQAVWSTPSADGGVTGADAGLASDGGVSADAGVLAPGVPLDQAVGCSTDAKGYVIELKSNRAIARPAVIDVKVTRGYALGGIPGGEARQIASP